MSFYRNWSPYSGFVPVTNLWGVPIELTTLLLALHVVATLVTAVVIGFYPHDLVFWQNWMVFVPDFWQTGHYWTVLTYPFYHNILNEHIFFVVEMVLFFWLGREVEHYMGRKVFAVLYLLLILIPPLSLLVLKPLVGSTIFAGSAAISFGMFVAFAVIYPGAEFFSMIAARWLTWAFIAVFSVYYLSSRKWPELMQLWEISAVTYVFMRMAGVGIGNGIWRWFGNLQIEREEKKMRIRTEIYQQQRKREEDSVDEVLEKISHHGMDSLSEEEHRVLKRASEQLSRREKGR